MLYIPVANRLPKTAFKLSNKKAREAYANAILLCLMELPRVYVCTLTIVAMNPASMSCEILVFAFSKTHCGDQPTSLV